MNHTLQRRSVDVNRALSLKNARPTLTDLEVQLLSSRGDTGAVDSLAQILAKPLKDLDLGAERLVKAIRAKEQIVVVADYDCDGATACAVMVAGLSALGARINYVVPDRMVHGYGISPSVVNLALERYPTTSLLVTVDNGILGHSGIIHSNSKGVDVIVTDHHLPGESLPPALAVINPSRLDCTSKLDKLAGVGVALWVVLAVKRTLLRYTPQLPNLNFLLPYVAIGTIADMVAMDATNRLLVAIGLDKIRLGQSSAGVTALIAEAGIKAEYLTTQDIGFGIAPRLNAAGRLDTMDAGIELLLTSDRQKAKELAASLTQTNAARKLLQKSATEEANQALTLEIALSTKAIVQGSQDWHPGIVGLVASRLKDTHQRPTFVFSISENGVKGSGRSIPGFHLKDALEEIARRDNTVLEKFGGHAMAAGATLTSPDALNKFEHLFTAIANERITEAMLQNVMLSDGPYPALSLEQAAKVLRHPWGQGFAPPAFDDEAEIRVVTPLGTSGAHWKIQALVGQNKHKVTVVLFNQEKPCVGAVVHLYMQPGLNTWKETTSLQWLGQLIPVSENKLT